MTVTPERVIELARECIGTPFKHQGRLPGVGMDCVGMCAWPLQKLEQDWFDVKGYPRNPYKGLLKQILDKQPCLKEVSKSEMQPGDFLLMKFSKHPQHTAIFTGETIIHSYYFIGKVAEHRLDDKWRRRIVAVYRLKALL